MPSGEGGRCDRDNVDKGAVEGSLVREDAIRFTTRMEEAYATLPQRLWRTDEGLSSIRSSSIYLFGCENVSHIHPPYIDIGDNGEK